MAVSPQSSSSTPAPQPDSGLSLFAPIWEIALQLGDQIPEEELAVLPADGAKNYKHYLYGVPKSAE